MYGRTSFSLADAPRDIWGRGSGWLPLLWRCRNTHVHIEKERGSQRRKPLTAGESGRRTRGRSLRRLRKKRGDGRSHQPPACVHPAPEGLRAESRVLPPAAPTAADTGRPGQRRGPSASTFCPDDQSDVPRLTLCGRGPSALLPESPHKCDINGGPLALRAWQEGGPPSA